ncbi:MAG: hypothetical protein CMH59_17325 [Myxococcales bacterium]|nr:hypothetical protein [Myxococcales bacterium]
MLLGLVGCGDDDGAAPLDDAGRPDVDAGPAPDAGPAVDPQTLAYLRADLADELVLEVDAAEGAGPTEAVLADFMSSLGAIVDKPGGIRVVESDVLPPRGEAPWTLDELRTLGVERFDGAGPATLQLLYVDGRFRVDGVLGVALSRRSLVVFRETVQAVCEGRGGLLGADAACRVAEGTVLLHETGHVLGLVNAGLPMQSDHEDPEHPGHDVDPNCVMYWAYESGDGVGGALDVLGGGSEPEPLQFCEASLADLATAAGR